MGRSRRLINRSLLLCACALLLIVSCTGPGSMSPAEYITWYEQEDHQLSKEKNVGEIQTAVMYLSQDYLALKGLDLNGENVKVAYEEEKQSYSDLQYFKLRIGKKEGREDILRYQLNDEAEYHRRVEYYAFMLKDDLKLVDGNDTLPCAVHQLERDYGLSPFVTMLCAFEKSSQQGGDKKIMLNERVFNSGPVQFVIKEKDINDIPHLKF